MPVGKNSIKRVENNGYSNVKTQAPDMENSTVVKEVKTQAKPKTQSTAKTVKVEPKKESAKASEKKAETTVKAQPKDKAKEEKKEEKAYINFGDKMPIYLL